MTKFIPFEQLSWPDVAALPRNTPLVIPLGFGYPLDMLEDALGNPSQIGLLPSFPFGWQGSGLCVPVAPLHSLINNLLHSLRDDGFSRVFALSPQGLNLKLGESGLVLPIPTDITSSHCQPLSQDDHKDKVVIIPIGHTEQHGYHLPLSTDTLIIDAIAQGTASAIPDQAFNLPVMPYGVSTHRQAFAGTLNCGGREFEDFWLAVLDHMVLRGFNRFYLMSGHGGNSSFLTNVVKYAGERYPHIFCATAWLYLSGSEGIAALEKHRRSPIGGMGHACELETSLLLHIHPELVQLDRAIDETDFITTPNYYMDWVEGGALIANPPWYDDTRTGAYGAGSLASAEHGQIWIESAIQEKIDHIGEIHTQYIRREARRQSGYGQWRIKSV